MLYFLTYQICPVFNENFSLAFQDGNEFRPPVLWREFQTNPYSQLVLLSGVAVQARHSIYAVNVPNFSSYEAWRARIANPLSGLS